MGITYDFAAGREFERVGFTKGEKLEVTGQFTHSAYIVTSGVCCYTFAALCGNLISSVVRSGGLVGGAMLLGDCPSTSNATMKSEGHGFKVPRARLLAICEVDHPYENAVLNTCFDRIAEQERMLHFWATASLVIRLAHIILLFAEKTSSNQVYLTHDEWASMLGAYRPAVTNAIVDLESHNVIRATRGQLHVTNISKLRGMVVL